MVLCKYFMKGNCRFGTKCVNEHLDVKQLSKPDVNYCHIQQTQQANAVNPEYIEGKEYHDCKKLLKAVELKSICKTGEEIEAATKVSQERTLINSAKVLSNFSKSNEPTNNAESIKGYTSILIKPKQRQRCSHTMKSIKDKIDPIKLSIQINSMIRGSNGSIIIECNNEESVKKLERHIEFECGSHFETEILHLCNPKILISGISNTINKHKLIGTIRSQNNLKHKMELVKAFEDINDSSKYNAIIEIDKELYEKLLEDKDPYFNIGLEKCNVYDNVDVKRCSKCWGFSHTANNCPDKVNLKF